MPQQPSNEYSSFSWLQKMEQWNCPHALQNNRNINGNKNIVVVYAIATAEQNAIYQASYASQCKKNMRNGGRRRVWRYD